jgi:ornithine decarboxylase
MSARFILHKKKLLRNFEIVKKISDLVSYSYKTNTEIGKILLEDSNCFFSVHSIESVNQLDSSRVWYFAQGWNKNIVLELVKEGVTKFVVDNENDLKILIDSKVKCDLLLRMRLKEHTIHTGKHYVYGFFSSKINKLIPYLRENKNIRKLGIHFHRKTQNVSEWSLKEELIDSIKHWDKIDLVNIGGGIPGVYKNYRPEVLSNIFEKISELRIWLNKKNIKMIIEPGRFLAASPIELESRIINIYDNNIIINCSVFNAAMDTFIANIRLLVKDELDNGNAYTIKGCTPDSMDIFRYKVYLKNPKIGDKIVFLNAGAYNFSSDFCNLPKLETVIK